MTLDWKGLRWHTVVDCSKRLVQCNLVAGENKRSVKTRLVRFRNRFMLQERRWRDGNGTWWRQSNSSVLAWSKPCKQWLRPCTVFSTWPATSVSRQGSELRGGSVWSLLRFARRSSQRVEVCWDSEPTCRTALSCSSPTVRESLSRQWTLPIFRNVIPDVT